MSNTFSYVLALLFALLLHGLVLAVMSINWEDTSIQVSKLQPYYIDASLVTENPYTAKRERQVEREQSNRDQRLADRRATEQKLQRDQRQWEIDRAKKLADREQAAIDAANRTLPPPTAPEPAAMTL